MQIERNKSGTESYLALKYYEMKYPWRDRRSGFERRKFRDQILRLERRSGKDRRCLELPEIIKYRKARTRLRKQLKAYQARCAFEHCLIGAIVLIIVMILLSVVVGV
jgi:hypothetical protein